MKKGIAQLVVFGIPVGAIIVFLFYMWVGNLILDEITPDLEKALMELSDSVVCPPEFSNSGYEVCISGKGEIIVNGNVGNSVSLSLDSNQKNEICFINSGEYVDKKVCSFGNIHKLESFNLVLQEGAKKLIVNSKNVELYIFSNQFIKIPVKKWKWFWKVTRYIPK